MPHLPSKNCTANRRDRNRKTILTLKKYGDVVRITLYVLRCIWEFGVFGYLEFGWGSLFDQANSPTNWSQRKSVRLNKLIYQIPNNRIPQILKFCLHLSLPYTIPRVFLPHK